MNEDMNKDMKHVLLREKLEKQLVKNPKLYKLKTEFLLLVGYGYVVWFVALFLTLFGFLVWEIVRNGFSYGLIKLALINIVVGYLVIKSLIVKNEMPSGFYVTEAEAGPLLSMVEELRKKIKTPKIHHIVVDGSYNAYVTTFYKFGFFTPSKNILVVGLPLMMGLTETQFISVLAHELAHISNKDTTHGAFTNRVIRTWSQIIDTLERDNNRLRFLFTWFGKWYTPILINQSFPLRRNAEYLADKKAAEATSTKSAAEALINIAIKGNYYGVYQERLHEETMKKVELPTPYKKFSELVNGLPESLQTHYLQEDVNAEKSFFDTHPTLLERVNALGCEISIPAPVTVPALKKMFADSNAIIEQFDADWTETVGAYWLVEVEERKVLNEMKEKKNLKESEIWELGTLTETYEGFEKALPIFENLVKSHPLTKDTAPAFVRLGSYYLEEEKESEGVALIRKGMEANWECKLPALNILAEYYMSVGKLKDHEKIDMERDKWEIKLMKSDDEAGQLTDKDVYVKAEADAALVAEMLEKMKKYPEIEKVYLARKVFKAIPQREMYLFAIAYTLPEGIMEEGLPEYRSQRYEEFRDEIEPHTSWSVVTINHLDYVRKNLEKAEGALIYNREG